MKKFYSILIIVFLFFSGLNAQDFKFTHPKFELLNEKFPLTNLVDAKGNDFTLFEEKNTIYVFNLWFTGCPPCVAEIPALNKLKKDFFEYKVKFIAVTFENLYDSRVFFTEHPFEFEQYSLKRDIIRESKLSSQGYPTTVLVDERQIIRFQKSGGKLDKAGAFEIYDILTDEIQKLNPKKK
jgi:thiol-disulfide isomerase/thioredoxin